jgi:hypothetical protein
LAVKCKELGKLFGLKFVDLLREFVEVGEIFVSAVFLDEFL